MSEVFVKEKQCSKCGAEIRRDTQFCYSCGEAVGEAAIQAPSETPLNVDGPPAAATPPINDGANRNGQFSSAIEDPTLTSASSLRRKGRAPERKRAEAAWEPSGNRANVSLIISTVVFAVFTIIVILVALASR